MKWVPRALFALLFLLMVPRTLWGLAHAWRWVVDHPVEAGPVIFNLIYLGINGVKAWHAHKENNLPRLAYYEQFCKANILWMLYAYMSPKAGLLWLFAALWYSLTPWACRAEVKKRIEEKLPASLPVETAEGEVWPPPPSDRP